MPESNQHISKVAKVGLPEASSAIDNELRSTGVDPERLSIFKFGLHSRLANNTLTSWSFRVALGLALWVLVHFLGHLIPEFFKALLTLSIGLLILQSACQVLVVCTERLAARLKWNHYVAGTVAEILSTTPELVVIAFIIPVSPATAFIITLITIYNNALVFSLYSFFLPKNKQGTFLMPKPITEAGTQILIGGGAMGLVLGLVMLTFLTAPQEKSGFAPIDLVFISVILLIIFAVYLYKLVTSYAAEEAEVRENMEMSDTDIKQRIDLVYEKVPSSSLGVISALFLAGIVGSVIGGEQVSEFSSIMIRDLEINPILTALILALFAGMSEYVILWQSHRRREYGIALANAFGGITQVMFLVLPITFIGIACYQFFFNPIHPELPIPFTLANIFLLIFLFPTFYILTSLLEEDHTLGILDTTIMTGIFLFLIVLLVTHGSSQV